MRVSLYRSTSIFKDIFIYEKGPQTFVSQWVLRRTGLTDASDGRVGRAGGLVGLAGRLVGSMLHSGIYIYIYMAPLGSIYIYIAVYSIFALL